MNIYSSGIFYIYIYIYRSCYYIVEAVPTYINLYINIKIYDIIYNYYICIYTYCIYVIYVCIYLINI
jgi:hypothetical protein